MSLSRADISDRLRPLTAREQQVATLVCEGLSNKVIARKLSVSEGTVKSHLHSVFQKLGVESRYALLLALDRIKSD
jgi:two-component system nitrate/nitrite response regulator NarL